MQLDGMEVPGHDIRVTFHQTVEDVDIPGERSGVDAEFKKFRPGLVQVTLKIRMEPNPNTPHTPGVPPGFPDEGPGALALLYGWFGAEDTNPGALSGNLSPHIYQVSDPTCDALGIQSVRFAEDFRVTREDTAQMWDVAFTLKDMSSIIGGFEQRSADPSPTPVPVATGLMPGGLLDTFFSTLNTWSGKFLTLIGAPAAGNPAGH
jgi:hypothetical protein